MFVVDLDANMLVWGTPEKPGRIHLTPAEAEVLHVLRERLGSMVSYETLAYRWYPHNRGGVDIKALASTHVCRINKKLKFHGVPAKVESIRYSGYELGTDLASADDMFLMNCLENRAKVESFLRTIPRRGDLLERAA